MTGRFTLLNLQPLWILRWEWILSYISGIVQLEIANLSLTESFQARVNFVHSKINNNDVKLSRAHRWQLVHSTTFETFLLSKEI